MQRKEGRWISTRELVTFSLLAGLMMAVQVLLAGLPNIEMVSLLVVLITRKYGAKALLPLYGFVLLEGLLYGFGTWFINYLYVWTVLWGITMLLRDMDSVFGWTAVLTGYGLLFGALCSLLYLFMGGIPMMMSYFISGIPFDLLHGAGNAAVALALFKPLDRVFQRFL